jgi:tRNA 2-thiouridine synthesizing protein A
MPDPTVVPEVPIDREVDARGSFCPGPLMELIRVVRAAPVGSVVAVLSSDSGSAKDIPAWVQKAGYDFLGAYVLEGFTRFVVRKTH